ncbi:uncharacterized protein LOC120134548 [Hibiscus syriacus]|uniref:uncharacterized protein LOC120134548 n=1 Tax=Hibiscus syriacus TaxID=106335 RepID=UPI0019204A1D|nr:uncharacterized protein LOC120134548 [Hibiscus syriacus]
MLQQNFVGGFKQFAADHLNVVTSSVSSEEVRSTLFMMDPLKAPGVDVYQAGFFQQNWSTMEEDVVRFVKEFFENGILPDGAKRTLLVLIPKIELPEKFSQFRPISLCLVPYKIITKILVKHLKPFLPEWVSENQVSFVQGRNITDNVILAKKIAYPLCKMDYGMCYFHVYAVVVEWLSHAINHRVANSLWKQIHLSKNGPGISHLFFSDDLVLFAVASLDQVVVIKEGFGFEEVTNLGKYIGVPLLHGRMTKETHKYLIEKVEKRLVGWVAKTLSIAGRITLAKVVLQVILYYAMQSTWLLEGVFNALEHGFQNRLANRFIGSTGRTGPTGRKNRTTS